VTENIEGKWTHLKTIIKEMASKKSLQKPKILNMCPVSIYLFDGMNKKRE
jgi:hypothetical protein